jgi:hypothetical protein
MSYRSASAQLERQIRTRTKARLRQAKAEGRLFEADIGPQTAVASTKVARKVERTVEPDPQGAVARVRGDREATRVVPLRDRGAPRQHDPEAILCHHRRPEAPEARRHGEPERDCARVRLFAEDGPQHQGQRRE